MQEVVMVHLLLKGFGLHTSQLPPGCVITLQFLSHVDAGVPLALPSSHSSPSSMKPSPQKCLVLHEASSGWHFFLQSHPQLLPGVPLAAPSSHYKTLACQRLQSTARREQSSTSGNGWTWG